MKSPSIIDFPKTLNDHIRMMGLIVFLMFNNLSFAIEAVDSVKILMDSAEVIESDKLKIKIYREGIRYSHTQHDLMNEAQFNLKIAHLYKHRGIIALSQKYTYQAVTLYEKVDSDEAQMNKHFNLALIADAAATEIEHNLKALELAMEIDDKKIICSSLSNLSAVYLENGKVDSAKIFIEKALSYMDFASDTTVDISTPIGFSYLNLGWHYMLIDEQRSAIEMFYRANMLFWHRPFDFGLGLTLLGITKSHLALKEYDSANIAIAQGLLIAQRERYHDLRSNFYALSAKLLSENGKFETAFTHLQKAMKIDDSLRQLETKLKLNEQLLLDELESHKRISELQMNVQNEEARSKLERARTGYILTIWILISLFAIICILLIFRKRLILSKKEKQMLELHKKLIEKEREMMETELKYAKKNLSDLAISIGEQNTFFKMNISQINQLLKLDNMSSMDEGLIDLKFKIHHRMNSAAERIKLNDYLNNLNAEFGSRLDRFEPKLSKSERHLLSLIYIDLSSKDIAMTLNISPESVNKKRYRLRKKLNLPHEVSFEEFLKERLV